MTFASVRRDLFKGRQCIHIKLTKDVHVGMRIQCFKLGVSMQELFGEFASKIASDDKDAMKIVYDLLERKFDASMKRRAVKQSKKIADIDKDSVYSLIESGEKR